MKIKTAIFERSAPDLASCPPWKHPEFALIGRSNVGKSSLINSLAGRRELARVSATPGKTQVMNFFLINGNWSLVDLPGYGYAKVGKEKRADFNEATAVYLSRRPNLRWIFVLIDSRIEPQAIDLDFARWLDQGNVPFAFLFTKVDKQSSAQTESNVARFKKAVGEWRREMPPVFLTSAETGAGCDAVLRHVHAVITASA